MPRLRYKRDVLWTMMDHSLILPHGCVSVVSTLMSSIMRKEIKERHDQIKQLLATLQPLMKYHPYIWMRIYDRLFWYYENNDDDEKIETGLLFYEEAISMVTNDEELYMATILAVRHRCVAVLKGLYKKNPFQSCQRWAKWMDAMGIDLLGTMIYAVPCDNLRALCLVSDANECASFFSDVLGAETIWYEKKNQQKWNENEAREFMQRHKLYEFNAYSKLSVENRYQLQQLLETRSSRQWHDMLANAMLTTNDKKSKECEESEEIPHLEWDGQPGYRHTFISHNSHISYISNITNSSFFHDLSPYEILTLTIRAIKEDQMNVLLSLLPIAKPYWAVWSDVCHPFPSLSVIEDNVYDENPYDCPYPAQSTILFFILRKRKDENIHDIHAENEEGNTERVKRQCNFFSMHIPQFKQSLIRYRRLYRERGWKMMIQLVDPTDELSLSYNLMNLTL